MHYNNSKDQHTYDAIVIGSGISGGWAAKELCEKGLKTIILERGRMVKHNDYPTANKDPWEFENRGEPSREMIEKDYPKQSRTGYTVREGHRHFFVKDSEHPYQEDKQFDWIRGYQVGGRSLTWGRQSYRWGPIDFEANARDGVAIPWPVGYDELAPWYTYVEKFIGVSGQAENFPQFPDGDYLPPMEMNSIEEHLRDVLKTEYNDRILTIGRTAHLTVPHNGRGACQSRDRCMRGCPYGAYFSSQSSTLPAAEKTGNMTIRPHSIVHSIIYDKDKRKATGVRVIDAESKEMIEFYARVIFLNASAIASTAILMNSKSEVHPEGLGASSGELGHNIMDHHFHVGARGTYEGFEDKYYKGRRPNGIFIPKFRNIGGSTNQKDFLRGYGYQGGGRRINNNTDGLTGVEFMEAISRPGPWDMNLLGFGECLPYHENRMYLSKDKTDEWGLPQVVFDAEYRENEKKMRVDMQAQAIEMLEKAGFKNIEGYDKPCAPGLGIHEMGTARMGNDPKTSVLNKFNQVHDCLNVFVTDGACMTSAANVNPSLTYMALTARATDYAVKQLNANNL